MYNFLTKHGQSFALGLGILVIAIFLISVFSGISADSALDVSTDLNEYDGKADITFFNPGIGLTLAMVIVAAVLSLVVFGIINLIKFPKGAMKFGLVIIVLLVVFGALYATSDMETAGKLGELHEDPENSLTEGVSKAISGGIKTTMILVAGAIVIMILSELRNLFK